MSVVVPFTLAQTFPRLCACAASGKITNQLSVLALSVRDDVLACFLEKEKERILACLTGMPCCHGSAFMLVIPLRVQRKVVPGSLQRMGQCLHIAYAYRPADLESPLDLQYLIECKIPCKCGHVPK